MNVPYTAEQDDADLRDTLAGLVAQFSGPDELRLTGDVARRPRCPSRRAGIWSGRSIFKRILADTRPTVETSRQLRGRGASSRLTGRVVRRFAIGRG